MSSGTPTTRDLPIKHAPGTKLTEQEIRGAGIFTQHCALCHLPKTFGADGAKFCCMPPVEPNLIGTHMFSKDMTPTQEAFLRRFIMNGGPTLMPAFKYGLDSKRYRRHNCVFEDTDLIPKRDKETKDEKFKNSV